MKPIPSVVLWKREQGGSFPPYVSWSENAPRLGPVADVAEKHAAYPAPVALALERVASAAEAYAALNPFDDTTAGRARRADACEALRSAVTALDAAREGR